MRRIGRRGQHAEVGRHGDHARRQKRRIEPVDLGRNIRQRGQWFAVRHKQRCVAELQIHVDHRHALGAARRQCIGQVGGQKGRAAAALAGNKSQHLALRGALAAELLGDVVDGLGQVCSTGRGRQHFAHAGAHRAQQKVL